MATKTVIPKKTREEIEQDPAYKSCMLYGHHGHTCGGRLTKEHTLRFAGKSYQAKWSIISLCARGHAVDEYQDNGECNKELNLWVALNRASYDELQAISKADNYPMKRERLNRLYGFWEQKHPDPKEFYTTANSGHEMQVVPIERERNEKPFFYKVQEAQKHQVQDCIDFFKDGEDRHYTPAYVITEAIKRYHEEIMNLKNLT